MIQSMAAQTINSNLNCITHLLHCLLLFPIEWWLHEVQSLVNFTIFSTTPQFFQIIQTEIGDTKKTISDTWFSAMIWQATCEIIKYRKVLDYRYHSVLKRMWIK